MQLTLLCRRSLAERPVADTVLQNTKLERQKLYDAHISTGTFTSTAPLPLLPVRGNVLGKQILTREFSGKCGSMGMKPLRPNKRFSKSNGWTWEKQHSILPTNYLIFLIINILNS